MFVCSNQFINNWHNYTSRQGQNFLKKCTWLFILISLFVINWGCSLILPPGKYTERNSPLITSLPDWSFHAIQIKDWINRITLCFDSQVTVRTLCLWKTIVVLWSHQRRQLSLYSTDLKYFLFFVFSCKNSLDTNRGTLFWDDRYLLGVGDQEKVILLNNNNQPQI